jgi:[acyl-carrier-protein] S-malonyltransferase
MNPDELSKRMPAAAFAFRGYNVTNLGRSKELLSHAAYGPTVRTCLRDSAAVCSDVISKKVDLVRRVRADRATTLQTYHEAVALILAMEKAQLILLREFFGIEIGSAKVCFGYSLGEVAAVAAAGVFDDFEAMRVPLALSDDCAELAEGVTLGVLFSRGKSLPMDAVRRLCLEVNQDGGGVIGISAHLSPNSVLLMGQENTLDRFYKRVGDGIEDRVFLRKTTRKFPPLHTPIMWQRNIPNRAASIMHTLPGGFGKPNPPVLSLVTGEASYNEYNAREHMHRWIDHPQLLWEVVYETLKMQIETIVHVGPEPNIIPATYSRLRNNVEAETRGSIGMRALTAVVQHPWIKPLLSGDRTALLHAPLIEQVILEDWLLEHAPRKKAKRKTRKKA